MSSAGDPATRLVVDLAAYQPIEEGVNLSIHNVRLQQICVAKKRRRFLRRRPPVGDAANGTNHVQKEGILIIGALIMPHACKRDPPRNAVERSAGPLTLSRVCQWRYLLLTNPLKILLCFPISGLA